MLTPKCEAARRAGEGAIPLPVAAVERMHKACPGAYLEPNGTRHPCECACGCAERFQAEDHERLPVLVRPLSRVEAPTPRSRATKAAKEATNTCECGCGSMVARRFLPGHDAKLKSALLAKARRHPAGHPEGWIARSELKRLGWEHFLK